ncbi:MAG: T9SS type A sorting domain-containing protein, partial [Pseudomonadota bacterium]|nr:T9SS type A sorting domain-containing protein [Pseudomonadota bacterium]
WSRRGSSWLRVKTTITNDCGSTILEKFIYPEASNRLSTNYFQVYPNPSNKIINVSLKNTKRPLHQGNSEAILLDYRGNAINTISIVNNKAKINISKLNPGTYLLEIKDNKNIETHQIIIE